jgi:ribosomal protein S12 methylthiotransferase
MHYHLVTLGCPKNVSDSERLERALRRAGHRSVDAVEEAEAIIVNSCGFIDAAKEESASVAAALARNKRSDQELLVIGCWAQIEPDQVRARTTGVDALFGIEAWDEIVEHLGPGGPSDIPQDRPAVGGRTSAYLKISDGCARPCTFCNIPAIKGRAFRSAPIDDLVLEAQRLAAEGVKELVLVAQDSTAYGDDLGLRRGDGLATLLERLAVDVPSVPWLRVMYAYPGFVSPRLVEAMASIPQVCHYLDMPLQHASPDLLRRMKRPHNMIMVHDTLDRLRAAMPDIALRTTFIVGFPGETKADFETLLDFMREARFDRAGAFSYSPQAGTPAATMDNQVPEKLRQRRLKRLMSVQAKIAAEINANMVGREFPVMVESVEGQRTDDGEPLFVGRSYRDAPEVDGLVFCRGVARPGTMPLVRITGAMEHDLLAEPAGADVISLTLC